MPLVVSVADSDGRCKCEIGSFVAPSDASCPVSFMVDDGFGSGADCVTGLRFFLPNGWFVLLELS